MVRVTLWLTADASTRLRTVCARDRISHTAALQSALECVHLFRLPRARRAQVVPDCEGDPLEEAVALAWARARELTHRRGLHRVKYVVPYEEDLLDALRGDDIGDGRLVSLSAAVSTVFLRWSPEEPEGVRAARHCLWAWALPRAQARVDARRLGNQGPPLGEGLFAGSS